MIILHNYTNPYLVYIAVHFKFCHILPDVKLTSYYRSATLILVLLTLFLSCLIAQTKNEPFADKKSGKEYYIQPVLETPIIDGNLTDLIWSKIQPITDFIQEDPDNMAEPTEKTAVYLTYNEKALYIAARMYDSDPSAIARQLAPQDDWYDGFDAMVLHVVATHLVRGQLVVQSCSLLSHQRRRGCGF